MPKIIQPIDLSQLEIRNVRAEVVAGNKSPVVEANFWYDSSAQRIKIRSAAANLLLVTDGGDLSAASVLNTALATNPLARANHTGSQTASTVSDLATVVQAYRLDQFAAPTAPVSFGSQKITSLLAPVLATDAANKQYVDDAIAGLAWKDSVRAATTANGALASAFSNGQVVDGVTLVTGNRILLKSQTAGAENGLYTVNASGAPTRATDADTTAKIEAATVFVEEGTTLAGTGWTMTTDGVVIGTTVQAWVQFSGGTLYAAGNGLNLVGATFNVVPGNGILADGSSTRIDTTVVSRKYATAFGDGSSIVYVLTHNLNTQDVVTSVYSAATPFAEVLCDVEHTSVNTITIRVAVAPTTNQYRAVVNG